ncbi:MAG: hypothetical protein CMP30_00345 [Roseibacillus sp.]|nr:hypothetical protein [Roseibacillus sp.]
MGYEDPPAERGTNSDSRGAPWKQPRSWDFLASNLIPLWARYLLTCNLVTENRPGRVVENYGLNTRLQKRTFHRQIQTHLSTIHGKFPPSSVNPR